MHVLRHRFYIVEALFRSLPVTTSTNGLFCHVDATCANHEDGKFKHALKPPCLVLQLAARCCVHPTEFDPAACLYCPTLYRHTPSTAWPRFRIRSSYGSSSVPCCTVSCRSLFWSLLVGLTWYRQTDSIVLLDLEKEFERCMSTLVAWGAGNAEVSSRVVGVGGGGEGMGWGILHEAWEVHEKAVVVVSFILLEGHCWGKALVPRPRRFTRRVC